jgi:hypothetical protein
MNILKQSILVCAALAGGFAACSNSSSNDNADAPIIGQGGAGGSGGAVGSGGAIASGGATVPDAGLLGDSGSLVPEAGTVADSGGGAADVGTTADAAPATADGSVPNLPEHLSIINGPPGPGVVPLDITGATPPTYDPSTMTCK